MNFCNQCGDKVSSIIPDGDNLPRFVCLGCNTIHYQNPNIVAGAIISYKNKILLCKRAIEPRYGFWTIPAGFMENNETVKTAALRETYEEALAVPSDIEIYAIYNLVHVNQVYIIFHGELSHQEFAPGQESIEVQLFDEDEIPWNDMAFKVVTMALKRYFMDRKTNNFMAFTDDVIV